MGSQEATDSAGWGPCSSIAAFPHVEGGILLLSLVGTRTRSTPCCPSLGLQLLERQGRAQHLTAEEGGCGSRLLGCTWDTEAGKPLPWQVLGHLPGIHRPASQKG